MLGEGITIWRSEHSATDVSVGDRFRMQTEDFHPTADVSIQGEGWGLTHDADSIIMSDGTASLRFLNPTTLEETRRLLVTDAGVPIKDLNELEYVRGEIYANVYQTDFIARISPRPAVFWAGSTFRAFSIRRIAQEWTC